MSLIYFVIPVQNWWTNLCASGFVNICFAGEWMLSLLGVANLVEADCCTLLCLLFYYPEVINDLWFFVLTTRSCAGPQAGEGCVVCHSPAWVKDIRINRQLSNITELYGNLDSLLNPTGSDYSGMLLLENKNNCIVHWLEWKCFYCFSQHPQIIIL